MIDSRTRTCSTTRHTRYISTLVELLGLQRDSLVARATFVSSTAIHRTAVFELGHLLLPLLHSLFVDGPTDRRRPTDDSALPLLKKKAIRMPKGWATARAARHTAGRTVQRPMQQHLSYLVDVKAKSGTQVTLDLSKLPAGAPICLGQREGLVHQPVHQPTTWCEPVKNVSALRRSNVTREEVQTRRGMNNCGRMP